MNRFKYLIFSFSLAIVFLEMNSCVETPIDEAVAYDDFYANLNDADAMVLGIYGKVMGLADRLVVLNELRGDMLDVTSNADRNLIEINQQTASEGNYYTDVTPFYEVIQNCNDALYNFDIMLKNNKLTGAEYSEVYSDIGAVRCWLYYQLGVQFGTIPYITKPLVSIKDVVSAKENMLDLDALIPELISFMEKLPTLEDYTNSELIDGTVDGVSLIPFFINKKCLLGDLYLFNNQYDKAATLYRDVLSTGEDKDAGNKDNSYYYRLNIFDRNSWVGGDVNCFAVAFNRYNSMDSERMYNAWKNMFEKDADDRYVKYEMIWEMSYNSTFAPEYPFNKLFATEGVGEYKLKPSTYAIDEMWGEETLSNGYPYDCRGISGGVSKTDDGRYVVAKYSMNYDAKSTPYDNNGKWFLYRAATLHLRFAEAANRSESGGGYPLLAWALVNDGIKGTAFYWTHNDGSSYRGDSIFYSSYGPGKPYPAPYYFDARNSNDPYIRAPWRDTGGIRGRAYLPNVQLAATTKQDSITEIEQMIVKEDGLELAFEGDRWTDLIRVARRLQKINGSGGQFLYDKLHRKYELAGLPMPDFTDEKNWYLPFYE